MPKPVHFFDAIGIFDRSLGSWEGDLERVSPQTLHSRAAQIHVRRSRDWIKPILDNPTSMKVLKDRTAIKYLKDAVIIIENSKGAAQADLASTCGAIDEALKCAYTVVQAAVRQEDLKEIGHLIVEPPTYDKTLSTLPGEPDFPTDSDVAPKAETQTGSLPRDIPTDIFPYRKR